MRFGRKSGPLRLGLAVHRRCPSQHRYNYLMKGVGFSIVSNDPYLAVRDGGAAVAALQRSLIRVSGSDRLKFLQGQVSNDVLSLTEARGVPACLLSNTGHLIADLDIFHIEHIDGSVYIETDFDRGPIVAANLKRFIIRERVEIEDVTAEWSTLTVQGSRAQEVVEHAIDDTAIPLAPKGAVASGLPTGWIFVTQRDRTGSVGFDIWAPSMHYAGLLDATVKLNLPALDSTTLEVLRIEAAIPKWGAELTEQVMPLEVGLDDRISYSKGCYMGQEVIARIHSRGHTNRTLVFVKFAGDVVAGTSLLAIDGERAGQEVGRVTSSAVSPRHGAIGLALLRNEYAVAGAMLSANSHAATVSSAPGAAT